MIECSSRTINDLGKGYQQTQNKIQYCQALVTSESESQQTPKSNKSQSPKKGKKEGFGPSAHTKITWASHPPPNHPTTPPPTTFKQEGVLW